MINTFRDIFYGYVAALALGLVLTIRVLNPALPSGLRLGLFIVIILVAAGIATWLTQKRILSCNEPVENCRLREGIDRLEGIMKTVRDHNSRVMFKLNEAAAYIDLGEYSRAVEIMKDANVPDKHSLREMTLMAIYQYQMAVALMETGLLDEAELRVTTLDYILGAQSF